MRNKLFVSAMLVCLLTLGLVLVGCDNGTTSGGGDGGDSLLNGTWVFAGRSEEFVFNNGDFEIFKNDIPQTKGMYSAGGGKLTLRITHVHGDMLDGAAQLGIESRWYSANELKSVLVPSKITENQFNDFFGSAFDENTVSYAVNGNTLTVTLDGDTSVYTRKD